MYKVSLFDRWEHRLNKNEREELQSQLNEVIAWFNVEIQELMWEYLWTVKENKSEIQEKMQGFFTWKSIYVRQSPWLAALSSYANNDRQWAVWQKTKKLRF